MAFIQGVTVIRIFLVDDDALIRSKLKEILEREPGWLVVGEAANGLEAVEKFASLTPNVTILDFQMPVMNGLDAARHLSGRQRDARLVLISAFLSTQLEEEAQRAGMSAACSKAKIDCIINAVKTVLKGKTYFESQRPLPRSVDPHHLRHRSGK